MAYNQFCSNCGKENAHGYIEGNIRYHCLSCKTIHYENPKPTATLICPQKDNILLVKRAFEPGKGLWGLPGGFIELNETPDQGALRELREETNLNGKVNHLLGYTCHFNTVFGDILLMAFLVEIDDFSNMIAGDDADDVKLFPISQIPKLAFSSHQKIIEIYLDYLKALN